MAISQDVFFFFPSRRRHRRLRRRRYCRRLRRCRHRRRPRLFIVINHICGFVVIPSSASQRVESTVGQNREKNTE